MPYFGEVKNKNQELIDELEVRIELTQKDMVASGTTKTEALIMRALKKLLEKE